MTSSERPEGPPVVFRDRVLALVASIPAGHVMTYGQLALLAGQPGAARQVGFIMNGLMGNTELPWQRVINAQGRVSTHKLGFGDVQQNLLIAEGVTFDPSGRCDLSVRQWWPEGHRDAPPVPMLGLRPPPPNGPREA